MAISDKDFILNMQIGFIECAEWADCPEDDGQTKMDCWKFNITKENKQIKNFLTNNPKGA